MHDHNYYNVSPTKIVRKDTEVLTYSSSVPLKIGQLVRIEVGSRQLTGVVMENVAKPAFTVKQITGVLYDKPLPEPLIATAKWISDYYQTHLATVWQTVLPRGIEKKRHQKRAKPLLSPHFLSDHDTKKTLSIEQELALQTIITMQPGTALLHGVTGSGKTLVYIELVKHMEESGHSSIILVPEIALTSQLVTAFAAHFNTIVLTHSRQTEAERHAVWQQVLMSNKPIVVIGPRSALFMPINDLGLIVVDECHEPSFKQEQAPRYSALRTGAILSGRHHAKLVLGSATPSVADYYLAKKAKRPIITMSRPARSNAVKPEVQLVDMTHRPNMTRHSFLSNQLLKSLETAFLSDGQALIFHNRRGTASTTLCEQCGWQADCPRCFLPLTLHGDQYQLRCHICGFQDRVPTSCPECQHADIIHKGIGTKRIEAELRRLFPSKTIARFDADTAIDQAVDRRYDELKRGKIDLIIGTQVIAKGLDLPHLRTVGVVQADAGLVLPDFAASERTFQLLAQVVGRVGRSHHSTNVIVQTYQPTHPAIQDGLSQNYMNFYQRTINHRQIGNFPPFRHLLKLTCTYKTEATSIKNSQKLAKILHQCAPATVEILGPAPAFYERVRDSYRWQLLLKSPRRTDLVDLLKHIPPVYWQAELDPISLL